MPLQQIFPIESLRRVLTAINMTQERSLGAVSSLLVSPHVFGVVERPSCTVVNVALVLALSTFLASSQAKKNSVTARPCERT